MNLLRHTDPTLRLQLSRDLVRTLKRGHPWVFADALAERPEAAPGSLALLLDPRGKPLALGMYDPVPTLSFRACRVASDGDGGGFADKMALELSEAWAEEQLSRALELRKALVGDDTTGYRLVNGEGDGMPGLVVDVYADTAVIRLDGDGPTNFWYAPGVARWVQAALGVTCVVERSRGEEGGRPLVGNAPTEPVTFMEHGIWFTADVLRGQKTGFFLDQRDNRARVRSMAAGRRVLNLFGYTGGFSVYAGMGGAQHVTTVDVAPAAIEAAQAHWLLNGLAHRDHEGIVADVFEYLDDAGRHCMHWDLVIADPPAFAPNQASVPNALSAYRRLIAASAAVTEPGGWLCAASCSSHVDMPQFMEACEAGIGAARRRATVFTVLGQPIDHPTPLAMPEFRYLKFVAMRVDAG
ncbi:MAG TPA: class I SAM-dependent rRNA methyltransferase [bacterium]